MKTLFTALLLLSACANQPGQRLPSSAFSLSLPSVGNLGEEYYRGPFALEAKGFGNREAVAYLPRQYESNTKWPLVVLLHGFTGTADFEDTYLTLRFRASRRGFILVTPEGSKTPPGTKIPEGEDKGKDISGAQFWNATDFCCDVAKTNVDDVAYLTQLIEAAKSNYHVDPSRIYVIGHSNGGFMANRLACEDVGAEIAGIANIAGGAFKNTALCAKPNVTPFLQIHAVDDPRITYRDSPLYAGGEETIRQWTRKNGCGAPEGIEKKSDYLLLVPGLDTSERSWKNCRSGKEVALWTIRAHHAEGHNSHIPIFQLTFVESVLDFLMRQSL